jgi:NAD(P)-dependent dehydrogenase (short-subunit alcohol dehydrogenase family)
VIAAMILGSSVAGIDSTVVAVALPAIGRNLHAGFQALQWTVTSYMRQQGSGAIVHVAARPGIEPASGMGAYSVSKAAFVHLTRILDIELRPQGIRVNAVAPQLLDTPRNRAYVPGGGDGARGRARGDRRRDRLPGQRRRRRGERSDSAGVRRLMRLTRRDAPAAPTRSGGRPIVIQLSRNSGTACSSTTWWTRCT